MKEKIIAEVICEMAEENMVFIHDPFKPTDIEVESAYMNGSCLQINMPWTSEKKMELYCKHWALRVLLNNAKVNLDSKDFEFINEIFKYEMELYEMAINNEKVDEKIMRREIEEKENE